ncbi:MAG: hypothetical protein V1847_03165 [Candidatus Diapherotrites archaeon]
MADFVISVLQILSVLLYSLLLAVPVCAIAWIGSLLRKRISKKWKISWIFSTAISTYVLVLIGVVALFAFPALSVGSVQDTLPADVNEQIIFEGGQAVDAPLSPEASVGNSFVSFLYNALRLLVVALVLTLLLLPLEVLASFASDALEKRKAPFLLQVYVASFVGVLIAFLVLIVFPWLQTGLLYYIFFG